MCGIACIYAYHGVAPGVDRAELRAIRDFMERRGPDGAGEWFSENGRVGFGHRRLSIIDLSPAGTQPLANEDKSLQLIFNGEIYNYKPLREKLQARGHIFQSATDSEVILHLYEEKGEALVEDLRGMFAFALWDANKGAMLLARDPYGIKPLYYADDGWTMRAASQVKALLAGGGVSRALEPAGLAGFYLTGSVPEPFTTYQSIRAVPAGSFVWVDETGAHAPKSYFSLASAFCEAERKAGNPGDAAEVVREAALDSVRHHLIADVPVSAFLSAGIDSGALLGLARDAGARDLKTVTLAFSEYEGTRDNEAPLAEEVARRYKTQHTTRLIDEAEFRTELPKILAAMDQPSIDGINTYFVSKAAAEVGVKVALSGLGGDELFGGYPSFQDIPRWVNLMAAPGALPGLGAAFRRFVAPLALPRATSPKMAGMLEYGGTYGGAYMLKRGLFMPWELKSLLGEELAAEGLRRLAPLQSIADELRPMPRRAYARVAVLEAALYMRNQLLRDTDWASMAHSLEVRVPLVDIELLKRVAPVMCSSASLNGKKLLAQSPSMPLPQTITQRAKTGFTVPVGRWLEKNNDLDVWRKIPQLLQPGSHWARRWAYTTGSLGLSL